MIYHKVHNDADASLMRLVEHSVIIFHRSELFHDRTVVTDIITIVVIGRLVDRREPDYINAQFFQIIQLFRDTVQIADSVPVAVVKTPRINLIYNTFLPPFPVH